MFIVWVLWRKSRGVFGLSSQRPGRKRRKYCQRYYLWMELGKTKIWNRKMSSFMCKLSYEVALWSGDIGLLVGSAWLITTRWKTVWVQFPLPHQITVHRGSSGDRIQILSFLVKLENWILGSSIKVMRQAVNLCLERGYVGSIPSSSATCWVISTSRVCAQITLWRRD
mgnify:CR=1 FL=1